MPRDARNPVKRRGVGKKRKSKPRAVASYPPMDQPVNDPDDDNDENDDDGLEDDDTDDLLDDSPDDDLDDDLIIEEPEEPALVSPRLQRLPNAADVRAGISVDEEESLESFVARYARYVEEDPDSYAFELLRVTPKIDADGNPCAGSVQEFWNTEQLTLEWLRANFAPGRYKLAVRGIGKGGKRGVYIGMFNRLIIAQRNPRGFRVNSNTELGAASRAGYGGGNNSGNDAGARGGHGGGGFVQWNQRGGDDGGRMAQRQEPTSLSNNDKLLVQSIENTIAMNKDMVKMAEEKGAAVGRAEAASVAMQQAATAMQAQPVHDPGVTTRALELISEHAKSGPREQSATEQRLLEQINSLRDDLGKLQTRHVEELSKARGDHIQEMFKERDSAMAARTEQSASYERALESERRRGEEMRSTLTTQHQAFVSSLEAQSKAHIESVRSSLETRVQALTDQLGALRDTLSQERTTYSGELSRLRAELSEEKTRSMTSQHDLVLAKVEAQTAEVKTKLAGDSLSNAGKMLANVKGFAEALGYVPAAASAVAEAVPESNVGALAKIAGAAAGFAASPEVLKFVGAAADRLRGTAGQLPQANAQTTAVAVAQWQQHREQQRAALAPQQPVPQIAAPQPVPQQQAPQPVQADQTPTDTQGMQDAIEDAALEGGPPEAFVNRIVQGYGIPLDTLRTAVAGATDAEVWGFLGVDPAAMTTLAREFGVTVLTWLRTPAPSP